jgi:hypothetical protein
MQILTRVDAWPAFSLSLVLRSLAAAGVYSPRLLTAAEPLLLESLGQVQPRALPDLLHSYSFFRHPCPALLPAILRLASDPSSAQLMGLQALASIAANAARLGVQPGVAGGLTS